LRLLLLWCRLRGGRRIGLRGCGSGRISTRLIYRRAGLSAGRSRIDVDVGADRGPRRGAWRSPVAAITGVLAGLGAGPVVVVPVDVRSPRRQIGVCIVVRPGVVVVVHPLIARGVIPPLIVVPLHPPGIGIVGPSVDASRRVGIAIISPTLLTAFD